VNQELDAVSEDDSTIINLTMKDEITEYIREIVANQVTTYTSTSPWNIGELLETLSGITGISFVESEYSTIRSASTLQETLTSQVTSAYDTTIEGVDDKKVEEVVKRAYLFSIDKNWMQHITDMQYLREKVGLYGYAQLDPLVIYKQEAYGKFQGLLAAIRQQAVAYAFRSSYEDQAAQQFAAQAAQQ
jgi:preprotein translocase subunit SecA